MICWIECTCKVKWNVLIEKQYLIRKYSQKCASIQLIECYWHRRSSSRTLTTHSFAPSKNNSTVQQFHVILTISVIGACI